MKRVISVFGYLAYILLAISMRSTAKSELSAVEENAGLFAKKFGIELEVVELELLCTILSIYAAIAIVALLIKTSHAALGFGLCGALNMLFDFLFCALHGLVLYAFITGEINASKGAYVYMIILFVVSFLTLFSNGASLSKPAPAAK